jgi:hypothetical protein
VSGSDDQSLIVRGKGPLASEKFSSLGELVSSWGNWYKFKTTKKRCFGSKVTFTYYNEVTGEKTEKQPRGSSFTGREDAKEGNQIKKLEGHSGQFVVSGSRDKSLNVWDVKTGEPADNALDNPSQYLHGRTVVASPDAKSVAHIGGSIVYLTGISAESEEPGKEPSKGYLLWSSHPCSRSLTAKECQFQQSKNLDAASFQLLESLQH